MTAREPLIASNEAIQYQGKSLLFQELILAFENLKKSGNYTEKGLKDVGVDKILKRHTGLVVKTEAVTKNKMLFNAYAAVPVLDINSPFFAHLSIYQKDDGLARVLLTEDRLKQHSTVLRGTVDRKRSRVSGIFSQIPLQIGLGVGLMQNLTAPQIAATYLHEVGHLFTFFEILTDTVSSNLAIAAASEALAGTDSKTERLEIIKIYQRATGMQLSDGKSLAEADLLPADGYAACLIREVMESNTRSATGSAVYDMRAAEFAADHFCSMHGAGRDQVTALDQLDKFYGQDTRLNYATFLVVEAFKLSAMALSLLTVPAFAAKAALTRTEYKSPVAMLMLQLYGRMEHSLYDDPAARSKRIRNNLVQALKLPLDNKERKALLDDIDFIDELTKDMVDRNSLFMYLWISLNPARRSQYSQIKFQKELEQMINNNIFVSANKLGQLA